METWVDIVGFDGWYQVSDEGRIRSCIATGGGWGNRYRDGQPWRYIPHRIVSGGRHQVQLHKPNDKKVYRYSISRLVWTCFKGPIPEGIEVDHIDRCIDNNYLSNFRLVTKAQNSWNSRPRKLRKYKGVFLDKRMPEGARCWNAALTVNKKRIFIGAFSTELEAVKAYNDAAIKYFGEFAYLNIIENEVH